MSKEKQTVVFELSDPDDPNDIFGGPYRETRTVEKDSIFDCYCKSDLFHSIVAFCCCPCILCCLMCKENK